MLTTKYNTPLKYSLKTSWISVFDPNDGLFYCHIFIVIFLRISYTMQLSQQRSNCSRYVKKWGYK